MRRGSFIAPNHATQFAGFPNSRAIRENPSTWWRADRRNREGDSSRRQIGTQCGAAGKRVKATRTPVGSGSGDVSCARSIASVGPLWSPLVSSGLLWQRA